MCIRDRAGSSYDLSEIFDNEVYKMGNTAINSNILKNPNLFNFDRGIEFIEDILLNTESQNHKYYMKYFGAITEKLMLNSNIAEYPRIKEVLYKYMDNPYMIASFIENPYANLRTTFDDNEFKNYVSGTYIIHKNNVSADSQELVSVITSAFNENIYSLKIDDENKLYFLSGGSGYGFEPDGPVTGNTQLLSNTWYHVAVTRSGSTWRLFLNGTQEDSVTQSSYITDSGSTTRLGNYGPSATASDGLNGYIEDFRITRGVARYTSNFTAPTSAHPTSTGDVNKVVVVNSSTDGVRVGYDGTSNQRRVVKAWADIDGTAAAASMIQSSYNISSMTDHGTGQYTFSFSTAMADADYSYSTGQGNIVDSGTAVACVLIQNKTTALIKVRTRYINASGNATDYDYNTVCIPVSYTHLTLPTKA